MVDRIYMTIFVVCFIVALGLTAYALYRKFRKKKKFIPAGTVMVRRKDGKVVPYEGRQDGIPIGILSSSAINTKGADWIVVSDNKGNVFDTIKVEIKNEK